MAQFELAVTLGCSVETAFEFLLRPANIERISPPDVGLQFLNPPERVEHGSRVAFEVSGFGAVQRLVHEIVELKAPDRFTERQIDGPLKAWRHEHLFEQNGGGVVVIDRIEFEPPGGMLGLLLTERRILSHLEDSFAHRHRRLKELLENSAT